MGKSRRKTPICGWTTCESEKQDKTRAHRIFRTQSRTKMARLLALQGEQEMSLPNKLKEVSNIYSFGKDGKQYLSRETIRKYRNLMRK